MNIPYAFREPRNRYGRYNELVATDGYGTTIAGVRANSEQFAPLSLTAYVEALKEIVFDRKLNKFISANIYPTLDCNNACPACFADRTSGKGSRRSIDSEALESMVCDLDESGVMNPRILGGGEATVYPFFDCLVDMLRHKGFALTLITNGTGIRKHLPVIADGFNLIRVSMDGADEETRFSTHGVRDFAEVVDNVCELGTAVKQRDDPHQAFGVTYIITKGNAGVVYKAGRIAESAGAHFISYRILKGVGADYFTSEERAGIEDQLRLLKRDVGDKIGVMLRFGLKGIVPLNYMRPKDGLCLTKRLRFLINADGRVQTCNSYNVEESWNYGNIHSASLCGILGNRRVASIAQRRHPVPCTGCCLKHANEVFYFIAETLRATDGHVTFEGRYNEALEDG